jgi:hypothetical protein
MKDTLWKFRKSTTRTNTRGHFSGTFSETGSNKLREHNWGATWKKK